MIQIQTITLFFCCCFFYLHDYDSFFFLLDSIGKIFINLVNKPMRLVYTDKICIDFNKHKTLNKAYALVINDWRWLNIPSMYLCFFLFSHSMFLVHKTSSFCSSLVSANYQIKTQVTNRMNCMYVRMNTRRTQYSTCNIELMTCDSWLLSSVVYI